MFAGTIRDLRPVWWIVATDWTGSERYFDNMESARAWLAERKPA
jgi:hypothetical protein